MRKARRAKLSPVSEISLIPLGGAGEIGKNITALRQGDAILVVDAGLSFPTDEMHGVDIVIPDYTYLRENAEKVVGIVLTHGHEDHVGALPYILSEVDVPVYGTELTIALVKRKLNEPGRRVLGELKTITPGEPFQAGPFEVEPIHMTHSLPQSCALAIRTAIGIVLFSGDFKIDFTPIDGKLSDIARLGELGDEGVTVLLSDCTNVEFAGWSPSERTVRAGFERVFRSAEGRIIITTFASNLHRLQQAIDVSRQFGRKVAIAGRSMEQTTAIGRSLGIIRADDDILVSLDECEDISDSRLTILATGSQGEPMAALNRIATDAHRQLYVKKGDTVIYSARPIPGNEAAIYQTINRLFRQGANVVYGPDEGVHVSGHGYAEELRMLINLTRPDYIVPVHGEPRHVHHYLNLAEEMGYSEDSVVVMENGMQLIVERDGARFGEPVPCGRILVDTAAVAGVPEETLRDRSTLARDGVIVITVAIDSDAGQVVGEPEVLARGVLTGDGELDELRAVLKATLASLTLPDLKDVTGVELRIDESARRYLRKQMRRYPMVVASVVDV